MSDKFFPKEWYKFYTKIIATQGCILQPQIEDLKRSLKPQLKMCTRCVLLKRNKVVVKGRKNQYIKRGELDQSFEFNKA